MVIVEALKHRLNQGKTPNLHFFRDAKGMEVDLLYPLGSQFLPIEIKAGKTIASEFFVNLKNLTTLLPDIFCNGVLVYSREDEYTSHSIHVCNYHNISRAVVK